MTKNEMVRVLKRLTAEIMEDTSGGKNICLIGIRSMGVHLAEMLKNEIRKSEKKAPPVGILDVSLYRDDFSRRLPRRIKETVIDFDIEGKDVVLVDDVIWTGRTIRAALDELIDFGRPNRVWLCVLIDRGGRELPVQPDFIGKKIEAEKNQWIEVKIEKGKAEVFLTTEGRK
ncbi:MAG: bifunctional pyr operon transcriptional regulator/uracil phosphoribosyltransferase PyrR [Elusimicrobia bacterium]|nr:bifunctional pyr operon transcriptional regulator/uracil phosphoribosyltransferase PyrR [Elusimicrobiota bacterium]